MIAIASSDDFHAAVAAATAKPLVVFFTSTACSKCEDVTPQVTALAEELAASAAFATVGAEELEALVKELQVDSFPHFRVYKDNTIAGDCAGATFDEVDAYVRGLVLPDTLRTDDATSVPDSAPEGTVDVEGSASTQKEEQEEAAGGACDAEAVSGSKKRQEREEMESNDGHDAKKRKTDDGAAEPVEDDDAVVTEEAEKTNVAPKEGEAPDGTKEKREEGGAADTTESSAVAASDVAAA